MSAKRRAIEALVERVQGRRVSRLNAFVAALGAGVLVYRLMRSGGDGDGEQADGRGESPSGAEGDAPATPP